MTGAEALRHAVARLKEAGIDDPARDARRLLGHVLGVPSGRLTLVLPDPLSEDQARVFDGLITRRVSREPVSHLIGRRAFFGRDYLVTPAVLDPRPETEILVEQALAGGFSRVLDLGTGSGCILLSLLAERPGTTGRATDLSADALAVARENAQGLGLSDRIEFAQGDWFDAVPQDTRFDLIVANPPYIALDEMPSLAPELAHEPQMALTDHADGLSAYRAITRGAGRYLVPGGRLLVEIGPTQGAAVSALFVRAGFGKVAVHPDLDGRDRVVSGEFLLQTDP